MEKENNHAQMTLAEYYDSLPKATAPKADFIKQMMQKCGVTQQAIYRWLKKGATPSTKEHCDIIAEIAKMPAEELFPLYREKYGKN